MTLSRHHLYSPNQKLLFLTLILATTTLLFSATHAMPVPERFNADGSLVDSGDGSIKKKPNTLSKDDPDIREKMNEFFKENSPNNKNDNKLSGDVDGAGAGDGGSRG